MSNSNRRKRLIIVSVAFGLLAVALWTLHHNTLSLLQRAKLAGQLHSDGEIPVYPEWISDHEAIFLRYTRDAHRFEFTRLDADIGKQAPMPELNTAFAKYLNPRGIVSEDRDAGAYYSVPLRLSLSPSRRRILI